jgi:hypothetical protein
MLRALSRFSPIKNSQFTMWPANSDITSAEAGGPGRSRLSVSDMSITCESSRTPRWR